MSMSSSHTKHALEDLHENIAVMRHPVSRFLTAGGRPCATSPPASPFCSDFRSLALQDHMGGEVTLFWSHHEKLTIVDSTRATVGGLDLCFGR